MTSDRAGVLCGLVFLCNCSTLHLELSPRCLSAASNFLGTAFANAGRGFIVSQVYKARYGNEEFSFHLQAEFSRDRIVMVALSGIGAQLFRLEDRSGMRSTRISPLMLWPLDPNRFLTDFQLAFCPLDQIRDDLHRTDYTVSQSRGETPSRSISIGGETVAEIHYGDANPWKGTVSFRRVNEDYVYDIETLALDPL